MACRLSHENVGVQKLYEKFLGAPGSEKSHSLLHTNYWERSQESGSCQKEVTHKHHR